MNVELHHIQPLFIEKHVIESSDLFDESVVFERGKRYLIQAPSGRGKSTLLNAIYDIMPNYDGQIKGNVNAAERFAYVPQGLRLFPSLSALENLKIKNALTENFDEAHMKELLVEVGLEEFIDQQVGTLSFGQRQRVAIVRALCMPFELLLMDEPFSHLDDENANRISALLEQKLTERNATLIIAMLDDSKHFKYDRKFKL